MKITNIEISNMLGIKGASIAVNKPVLLLAGANGAGKSSVAEAVKHALISQCDRVTHKKDFAKLLHNSASAGHAIITAGDMGDYGILLPEGKQTGADNLPFALEYCLNPGRFASVDANERRSFLFKLMGVKITPQAIIAKLTSRGIGATEIKEINPHLASGFEAAHKEAQAKARDAKTAWRTITGETYGAVKAETWEAPKHDELNQAMIDNAEIKVKEANDLVELLSGQLGALKATEQSLVNANAFMHRRNEKIEALREHAGKYARIQDKLNRDKAELAEWELKVVSIEGARHSQNACACPACGVMLVNIGNELQEAGSMAVGTEDDIERLPEYIKARDLFKSAVANGERDLQAADNAARNLAELEAEVTAEPKGVTEESLLADIDAKAELLATAKSQRQLYTDDAKKIEQVLAANKAEEQKTKAAKEHHGDVKAWDEVADALAPSGIPAELLNDALAPFNKHLENMANLSEWPAVKIDADMELIVGGREYRLRSESEKWRADAMIAATIAHVSKAGIIMLDRFDVLDLKGRGEALYWFDDITCASLSTVIVMGTLKAIPAQLPDSMQAVWISDCVAMSKTEAAA